MSGLKWVADIYDDPTQYLLANPESITHRLRLPVLKYLLNRADIGYNVLHPTSPNTFGTEIEYGINGAPVEVFAPRKKASRPPLQCVVVGKTEPEQGIDLLMRALRLVEGPVHVDIYGEPIEASRKLAVKYDLNDVVTFHGWEPHETIIEAVSRAHVGLSLLPRRTDWTYSYPIKIGEYLAAETLPVATGLPATRRLAGDAGIYVAPDPEEIADQLDALASIDDEQFLSYRQTCRQQAKKIDWADERERFVAAILGRSSTSIEEISRRTYS
ncbi:glycosyltransferase [Halomarina pelagica]|uniref:glycosyltransferase n=1 Tax=Halomarina pelagica TaxID=2961599 RepID=UPI0020C570A3|nr:glycosyltransferase [Halomarina sp. BND7]